MNDTSSLLSGNHRVTPYNELAPPGLPLEVTVVPDLLGGEQVAVRDDDDTDEDYAAKQQLIDAVLALARKG